MRLYNNVREIYNSVIRDSLPLKERTLAQVQVHDTPLLDRSADNPAYKIGFILSIHDYISEGDSVEIIGFGRGVSTVHVLRAGADEVVAYEAAPNMIETGIDTLRRNLDGDAGNVEIRNAIIGDPIDVYGDFDDAEVIPPSDLSDADVLVLDCEGAEKSILSNIGSNPEIVICETHPTKGAPAEDIISILDDRYDITARKHKLGNPTKVVIGVLNQR